MVKVSQSSSVSQDTDPIVPLSDDSWVRSAIWPPSPNSNSSEHRATEGVVVAAGTVVVGAVVEVVVAGVALHAAARAISPVAAKTLVGTWEG
jgi:hypothetical protein